MTEPVDPQGNPIAADVGARPAVRLRDQISAALDAACHDETLSAVRAGHDPHPWSRTTYTASTACRRCGATVNVTVHPDLTYTGTGSMTAPGSCTA